MSPAPAPFMTECRNLSDHFRCMAKTGKNYSDPYPGKEPLVCFPVEDWEIRKDWESTLK